MNTENSAGPAGVEKPDRTYWAYQAFKRGQSYWLGDLEKLIAEGSPVRLFDELLDTIDWKPWEREYAGNHGQPPIHPRILAGIILFGLVRGVRSSRRLEEACELRLDFRWLALGHRPDHSTFCQFRTRFEAPLKDLFRRVNQLAMSLGLIRLGEVAYDGTRVKSYNSRYRTLTAEHIEKKLKELDGIFDEAMRQFKEHDEDAEGGRSARLPNELGTLQQRRAKLQAVLERARAEDEERHREGLKTPVQIPMSDTDSRVMPNKEGGYAPNYTPTAVTDGERGFIVDVDVLNSVNEGSELVPAIDRVETTYGKIEVVMTDAGNCSGPNLQSLDDRDITVLAPVKSSQPEAGNPALRDDPREPVPESEWPKLPRNSQGQLDKSCFVFVPEKDCLYCPQGQPLRYEQTKKETRGKEPVSRRVYRCQECDGCPLKAMCVSDKGKRGRTVTRDQYEQVRQETAKRMSTAEAKERYNQRPQIAETTFGILKGVFGIRQFLLRGLPKVRIEWQWAATAFNIIKLVRELGTMRAEFARMATRTT